MFINKINKTLGKELKLLDVFAITTGATLSGGFFLLPGLAAAEAGTKLVLAYLFVAIPLFPAVFSLVEIATAMPRSGGIYYFLDRALGPRAGTIGGIGTWFIIVLKSSFALIGMGAYLSLFFKEISIIPIAIIFAISIGILNLFTVKGSGKFQILLATGLLIILIIFVTKGVFNIKMEYFQNIFSGNISTLFATTGLVYISYAGITKVVSLSEEIKNPERNLPLGIFLGLITSYVIYAFGTFVIAGIVPIPKLANDLTPVATAANIILGNPGVIIVSIAAILAFISVANAGILSASRYPFAMSRDYIIPHIFKKLNKVGIPFVSIIFTVLTIIFMIIFLNPMKIAELASTFQLIIFALVSFSVIIMRESRLDSYDPGYKSPLYPWMQIIGILSALFLVIEMGWLPIIFSSALLVVSVIWFNIYAKNKVKRSGAIYHVFERLGKLRYSGLDIELREILKEKGLRKEDPFDEIVTRSLVITFDKKVEFDEAAEKAAAWFSNFVPFSAIQIKKEFLEGTKIGMTPVTRGIGLPHLRMKGLLQPELVLVRSNEGIHIIVNGPLTNHKDEEHLVKALFFLASPEDDSAQHLRILAQIAGRVDDDNFIDQWLAARNEQELKEILLRDKRFLSLRIIKNTPSGVLIGKQLKDADFPHGCLVALINRDEKAIIPKGDLTFQEMDKLTIIGDEAILKEIEKKLAL